jgi:hypothetical protein
MAAANGIMRRDRSAPPGSIRRDQAVFILAGLVRIPEQRVSTRRAVPPAAIRAAPVIIRPEGQVMRRVMPPAVPVIRPGERASTRRPVGIRVAHLRSMRRPAGTRRVGAAILPGVAGIPISAQPAAGIRAAAVAVTRAAAAAVTRAVVVAVTRAVVGGIPTARSRRPSIEPQLAGGRIKRDRPVHLT